MLRFLINMAKGPDDGIGYVREEYLDFRQFKEEVDSLETQGGLENLIIELRHPELNEQGYRLWSMLEKQEDRYFIKDPIAILSVNRKGDLFAGFPREYAGSRIEINEQNFKELSLYKIKDLQMTKAKNIYTILNLSIGL